MRGTPNGGTRMAKTLLVGNSIQVLIAICLAMGSSSCQPAATMREVPPAKRIWPTELTPSSVPTNYLELTFDQIGNFSMDQVFPTNAAIPQSAHRYDGDRIMLTGEMVVPDTDASFVDHFAICDPKDLEKTGNAPDAQRVVIAYVPPNSPVLNCTGRMVTAFGILEVGLQDDRPWYDRSVYRLRLDRLEAFEPARK